MKQLFIRFKNRQSGQALLIVMGLMLLGTMAIGPGLSYATTAIGANNRIEKQTLGVYAAEAGVEQVLWSLENSQPAPTELGETINGMNVSMVTTSLGEYTLVFGTLVPTSGHSDYLRVEGSIAWDASANAYKYIITVTKQNTPSTVFINRIGACLPVGYGYVADSADSFSVNLSREEPEIIEDTNGADLLNWEFNNTRVNPVKTQSFYITGSGDLEGDYTWVVANRNDVGEVGEVTGSLYSVTATATEAGTGSVTAIIDAKIMIINGAAEVISWQITK